MASLTFIDLFCGCGGFSLGLERAGLRCLAAIDSNAVAIETFRANFTPRILALQRDLTLFGPAELAALLGVSYVDVVVGGPPCQGFSGARKVDGTNHGARIKADPRRFLYRPFLQYVHHFQPRVFVMENVLGLRSAAGGDYFTAVQSEARSLGRYEGRPGYRVHAQVEDATALGVPQKRRRQLIIGVRNDLVGYFPPELKAAPRALAGTPLGAAIGDLPRLAAGGGVDECDYDRERRRRSVRTFGVSARNYLYRVLEVQRSRKLTAHRARPHSARDLRDFKLLREGESSAQALRRGVAFEWPYRKDHFRDRYTRQSRFRACSTIVAHLSHDGLMFIHPRQNRSLTPREAARIQSFPDWFVFPSRQTHQFRMIGNAVPPLVAEAVGFELRAFLGVKVSGARQRPTTMPQLAKRALPTLVPRDRTSASLALQKIAALDRRQLRSCSKDEFLRGWIALLFLFPDLHPANARDHGDPCAIWATTQPPLPSLEQFETRRFARSGWPVALEAIGREAWRRFEANDLDVPEFYCASAQRAGMRAVTLAATR